MDNEGTDHPEQILHDCLVEAESTIIGWRQQCEEQRKRLRPPPELARLVEDVIIAAAEPTLPWPPGRRRLLTELTKLAKKAENRLEVEGSVIDTMNPWPSIDGLLRVIEAATAWEMSGSDEGDEEECKILPTLFELRDAQPIFVARVYSWLLPNGEPDQVRARIALEQYRAGLPVLRPSKLVISPVRTRDGLVRHPGAVQFVADQILQRREERDPALPGRTVVDEIQETIPQAELTKALARK